MRCKACDAILSVTGDTEYCGKCITASKETDVREDTVYRDNHELMVQQFLSRYERAEILNS